MTTDLIKTRAEVEALLQPLWLARQAKNAAAKDDEKFSAIVRQWLELNDGEALVDGEHDIRAHFQRRALPNWDIRTAPIDLILALRDLGLLDVRNSLFDKLRSEAPSMWLNMAVDYRHEGESWSLRVEKTK